jgi:hypothetical protein
MTSRNAIPSIAYTNVIIKEFSAMLQVLGFMYRGIYSILNLYIITTLYLGCETNKLHRPSLLP